MIAKWLIGLLVFLSVVNAENLVRDFELYKLNEGDKRAPTLLLMGGIHGDEPGAYYSSDLFLRHYKITKGSVWVVPVVNPHGMFANMRGVYGDMNRKFAALSSNDPDYATIMRIKELLAQPEIDISLHLHDGSGYWRSHYVNALLNPHRWGNCSVVDQPVLEGVKYGELEGFVTQMVADINQHILAPIHAYHVHNTDTKAKSDQEQLKALTFYSLSIRKPALTNEASKELDLHTRVYYHLLAIESLMGQLGIGFERDFELTPKNVSQILSPSILQMKIEERISLPLVDLRPQLTHFPLPKNVSLKNLTIQSQSRILGLVNQSKGAVELKYGYKTLSTLYPDWIEFDNDLESVKVIIDGVRKVVPVGSIIEVKESIEFEPIADHRVNVIGYVKPNDTSERPNETGVTIYKKDFIPRFSLDKNGQIYRAEIYKDKAFSAMLTISFAPIPVYSSTFINVAYQPAPHSPLAKKLALAVNENDKIHALPKSQTPPSPLRESNHKASQETKKPNVSKAQTRDSVVAYVKSQKGVNVRLSPSTQSAIVGKLAMGAKVEIVSNEGKWSKIKAPQGYVISQALIETPPKATNASPLLHSPLDSDAKSVTLESPSVGKDTPVSNLSKPANDSVKDSQKRDYKVNARVIVNVANVRLAPSQESASIAKAPLGREMEILSIEGEWAHIYYVFQGSNGERVIDGYIAKRLLKGF
ncbi:M99 family carboxypeptidase catalytic domain-containing protein [Helicobacter sp. MIT 05-5293]|uniref:M99 family carboxypeptidase catalytic domain-containing protein n=1 Tax=Helicobacter sp. MIT 05-5293 TaxID=1548149 RepID=UPI000AE961BD|nr:M99 family carboxypeptidase catalytic domain-containing protein [Helicobacter sp. MIT 05-5293]